MTPGRISRIYWRLNMAVNWADIGNAATQGMKTFGASVSGRSSRRGGGGDGGRGGGAEALMQAGSSIADSITQSQANAAMKRQVFKGSVVTGNDATAAAGAMNDKYDRGYKKGGRIKKTGVYRLHAGEFVVNAEDVKRVDRARKSSRKTARR
jgi:hypothetical protein